MTNENYPISPISLEISLLTSKTIDLLTVTSQPKVIMLIAGCLKIMDFHVNKNKL